MVPPMADESQDLAEFLLAHGLKAELIAPGVPMPTVTAAAAAMRVASEQIFKPLLFQSPAGRCVLVVACGNARVDVKRVETLTGISGLKLAKPDVVFERTGYPAGGTPPVGHRERLPAIVDTRVAAQEWGYAGGGRPELLAKFRSIDIIRLASATVADVVASER